MADKRLWKDLVVARLRATKWVSECEEDFIESLKSKYVKNGVYYDSVESYQILDKINGEIVII